MGINFKDKIYLTPLLGWGLVFLLGCSCGPTELPRLNLEFEIPVTTLPAKEIYSIGDTLTIEIKFPKKMIDRTSEFSYEFEDFDFRGAMRFLQLVDRTLDQPSQPGAFGSVKLLNENGGLEIVSDSGAELNYYFDVEQYILRTNLVLHKPGIYSMSFFTRSSSYGDTSFKKSLNIPGYIAEIKDIYYKVNEGMVTNTHLINENTINNIDEDDGPNSWHRPFFSFRVIERP